MVMIACGACEGEGVLPDLDGELHSCLNCLGSGGRAEETEEEWALHEPYGCCVRQG